MPWQEERADVVSRIMKAAAHCFAELNRLMELVTFFFIVFASVAEKGWEEKRCWWLWWLSAALKNVA